MKNERKTRPPSILMLWVALLRAGVPPREAARLVREACS